MKEFIIDMLVGVVSSMLPPRTAAAPPCTVCPLPSVAPAFLLASVDAPPPIYMLICCARFKLLRPAFFVDDPNVVLLFVSLCWREWPPAGMMPNWLRAGEPFLREPLATP